MLSKKALHMELFLIGVQSHLIPEEFMKALPYIESFKPEAVFVELDNESIKELFETFQKELYTSIKHMVKEFIPVSPGIMGELTQERVAWLEYGYAFNIKKATEQKDYEKYAFPIGGLHLTIDGSESPLEFALKKMNVKISVSEINLLNPENFEELTKQSVYEKRKQYINELIETNYEP